MIALVLLSMVAEARTPDWVRQFEDRTEVCAVPESRRLEGAVVPELTALQQQRRELGEPLVGPLRPPLVRTLTEREPAGLSVSAIPHPLRKGWSLVRVELSVAPSDSVIDAYATIAVDTSASMSSASFRGVPLLLDEPPPERGSYRTVNRLDLVKEALHELVEGFDDPDYKVAVVAFHQSNASELLPPTASTDHAALHAAIEAIERDSVGDGEVFETMFTTAAKSFQACGDGRLLLITDDRPAIKGDPADVMAGLRAVAEQGVRVHSFPVATKVDVAPLAELTSAGGGALHRVDTIGELMAGFAEATRPIGSTLGDASLEVSFGGAWRWQGEAGTGTSHGWKLPEPLPSDWTMVELYEVEGSAEAVLSATPYFGDTSPRVWRAKAAVQPVAKAPAPVRHDAAYVVAEQGIREPAMRRAAQEALEAMVREVGPGREAQALLEAHAN